MLKILIVDDNTDRINLIKDKFDSELDFPNADIFIATSSNSAEVTLRNHQFDILILDVVLPKKEKEKPDSNTGLKLLDKISSENSKMYPPNAIIGITSFVDNYEDYQREFEKKCFLLLKVKFNDLTWLDKLVGATNHHARFKTSTPTPKIDTILLTVHGIRTYGQWQETLAALVKSNANNVDVNPYKYGYFPVFSLLIPHYRNKEINRFIDHVIPLLTSAKSKRIVIVAHSFGTYIAAKSLCKLTDYLDNHNITLIFSGSILNPKFDMDFIPQTRIKVINDCGDIDIPLIASNLCVPGCSMAGIVGFTGFSKYITNRYHNGGHDLYFCNIQTGHSFMKKYWLPHILQDTPVHTIERKTTFITGPLDTTLLFLGKFSLFYWLLLISATVYYFIN
jgi:CheY-like chemotaxis protein